MATDILGRLAHLEDLPLWQQKNITTAELARLRSDLANVEKWDDRWGWGDDLRERIKDGQERLLQLTSRFEASGEVEPIDIHQHVRTAYADLQKAAGR